MPKSKIPKRIREQVIRRANGCCEYCRSQASFATQSFSIEHIIPKDKGGADEPENLALACQGCNGHKSTKTEGYDPVSRKSHPLFHPRTQRWKEHFKWSGDYTRITGITPTGRATVETLKMNREGLLKLRRAVYAVGEHPPEETV